MKNSVNELLGFIKSSPSAFHAVEAIKNELRENGYTELSEAEEWKLSAGGKYFVTRNLSSITAFKAPKNIPEGYMIAASHSDSPSFMIKENPESETAGLYTRINVEKYGGMICAAWLDRPLSAAGRAVVSTDNGIKTVLVDLDRDLFLIPSVSIHMNRSTNENASYNPAVDMQPISGSTSAKGGYNRLIAEKCGCGEEEIISSDMFLYCREDGRLWGVNNEFVSSPRLDDLQCAFGTLKGFLASEAKDGVCPVLSVFDNEEVGSGTKQGAASTFLFDTLARINESFGGTHTSLCKALSSSFMVSADNAHAVHPNHPEYADPAHRPAMNGGIVIKHNANQRYTTDAVSSALFTEICRKAGAPVQHFANRADLQGGSTLGNISNTNVALNTVDIGLAQLSMHSAYETSGANDVSHLIDAMSCFFSCRLKASGDGEISIEF